MRTAFAVCVPGLEKLLARELHELGVEARETVGGAELQAADVPRVNLWSRVASRVLVRLGEVRATTFPELVRKAQELPWAEVVRGTPRVAFRVTCRKSRLYHSDAVAERLFAGLQATVPGATLGEADEEAPEPHAQLFVARFERDVCTVSADSSGALLHQRGYRTSPGKAPLRETLAAAMVLASGGGDLLDPLCGVGTIPIEAALIALERAPGLQRGFAFEGWPGHDAKAFAAMKDAGRGLARMSVRIEGSDADPAQIAAARENAARAGVELDLSVRDLRETPRSAARIVTNPPYGVRLESERGLWRELHARGATVLSPDERPAGLGWRKLLTTQNGGLRVHLLAADAHHRAGA